MTTTWWNGSTDTYHYPGETRFSSGRMPVPDVLPCSIHLHAHAGCKASTSLNIYLTSSTRQRRCRREHRQASTGTGCRTNGNKKISLKNKNLGDIFLTVYTSIADTLTIEVSCLSTSHISPHTRGKTSPHKGVLFPTAWGESEANILRITSLYFRDFKFVLYE